MERGYLKLMILGFIFISIIGCQKETCYFFDADYGPCQEHVGEAPRTAIYSIQEYEQIKAQTPNKIDHHACIYHNESIRYGEDATWKRWRLIRDAVSENNLNKTYYPYAYDHTDELKKQAVYRYSQRNNRKRAKIGLQ